MLLERKNIFEIIRFGIVGVVATALHYGIYLFLKQYIGLNTAYTTGYILSFIANYLLSARFTFRKKKSVKNGLGFGFAHIFNYLLQTALLNIFVRMGVSEALAPVPVYCIAIPTNFLIVRSVFRRAG